MAINSESAKENAYKRAVTCCRIEAGTIIEASNLEDPKLIPMLESSGLLKMSEDCLKIGEVIGAKVKETVNSLTPLTSNILEGVKVLEEKKETPKKEVKEDKNPKTGFKEKIIRTLTRKHFKIEKVEFADETKIEGTILYIRKDAIEEAINTDKLVVDMKVDIITPDRYSDYSETIMDIQPIATKEEGDLGEGTTRIIDGVVVVVTGTDEDGVQIGEFGSSEGKMDRNIMWGRPGSADKGEIFIKTQVTILAGKGMERPGPMAVHHVTDLLVQEIREALKLAGEDLVVKEENLHQKRRLGKKKIVIVKEIMGQGAMHDNYIMPTEPVGTLGAKANVDLGNVPVVVSPLQVLDGCIHALTCIGPASKETSRHYFRDPLVIEAMKDPEIDLAGVIFVGSPQANTEKFYVSNLLGMTIEAMDLDGAIITTEGFGNNHIDFASHIEQVGKRGISVVGVTYSGVQGELVVGNKYMDAMVDNNKSSLGIEDEILSNNCHAPEDAIRAMMMLKAKMAGEDILEAEVKWSPQIKIDNIGKIEDQTGRKIHLEENETSLAKSKKRQDKSLEKENK